MAKLGTAALVQALQVHQTLLSMTELSSPTLALTELISSVLLQPGTRGRLPMTARNMSVTFHTDVYKRKPWFQVPRSVARLLGVKSGDVLAVGISKPDGELNYHGLAKECGHTSRSGYIETQRSYTIFGIPSAP